MEGVDAQEEVFLQMGDLRLRDPCPPPLQASLERLPGLVEEPAGDPHERVHLQIEGPPRRGERLPGRGLPPEAILPAQSDEAGNGKESREGPESAGALPPLSEGPVASRADGGGFGQLLRTQREMECVFSLTS